MLNLLLARAKEPSSYAGLGDLAGLGGDRSRLRNGRRSSAS